MPASIGHVDHTMIPSNGLNYKGMPIWDDRAVPSFEKHSASLGVVGIDNVTLDTVKTNAEKRNARGLSVDAYGRYYAVKRPSQVEGFGNRFKVYAAAALYSATSHQKIALAILTAITAILAGVTIYEGVEKKKLSRSMTWSSNTSTVF